MKENRILLLAVILMSYTNVKAQDSLATQITYETTQPSNLPPTDITCSVLGLIRPICVEPSTSLMLSTGT